MNNILISARGSFFLLFTNRYVLHGILLIVSVVTIASQFQTANAAVSDVGQKSLLYAIVSHGQDEMVTETIRPEMLAKNANYLGAETLQALPDLDFDYEEFEQPVADINVPGSIAARPDGPIQTDNAPEQPASVPVRHSIETYVVKSGDTVASIAHRFGLDAGTVIWANGLGSRAQIRPGDQLKILPVSGVLHTVKKGETLGRIANTYKVEAEKIAEANDLNDDRVLAVNTEIIIPGGTPIVARTPTVAARPSPAIPNKAVDRYQEILTNAPDTRAKPADLIGGLRQFLWPTDGKVITQYYGWRHTGVDIDCDYGNPHYAVSDGVVEASGWNSGGYGLQTVINHENGYKTRYAHASKLFLHVGDNVKQGQVIAMCGTTGRSTGTHLHFEVYKNGVRQNPLAYIK